MPSSCHNDSNFLFPPLISSLPPVSPFLTSPSSAPRSSSSVCCLKPSNEIHTKQDGRLDAFLLAILSASLNLPLASSSFVFLSYSLSLHLPCLYCPFHLSFTLSSISLSSYLSLCGPPFLPGSILLPLPHDFFCLYPSVSFPCHPLLPLSPLNSVSTFPFLQGPTWKHVGYFSSHLFRQELAV